MRVTAQKRIREPEPEVEDDDGPESVEDRAASIIRGDDFKPAPTIAKFFASSGFVRGVRGPVGSGKSSSMCREILRRASEQVPAPDGIRYTRWAVVRNTYGELKDTTIKTWLEWVPEAYFGKFNRSQGEMRHHITVGDINCEVLFRALDKPEDVKKVLSLELTGAWINEAREVPKAIVDALGDRVGRYPAVRNGGCTWRGIMMDTNSPDNDHWWFHVAEEMRPNGWDFFAQPPGLIERDGKWIENPDAENIANLEPHYYLTRSAGKRVDYIRVYYANEYGFVQEGKPVFPEYADTVHGAKSELAFISGRPVYLGVGLGAENAALFGQKKVNGQWIWIDELMPDDSGVVRFAELLSAKMKSDFPGGTTFKVFGPKAVTSGDETDEALQILRRRGIAVAPTRQADATLRREAVASVLNRLVSGEAALSVSPKCKIARKAMAGGFCYARMQVAGEERYHDEPMKNRYLTMGEAAEFVMVGGGEDAFVFKTGKPTKLKYLEMGIV